MRDCGFPPAPRSADTIRRNHFFCVQFGQTSMDGASRDTRGAGNEGNPAVAETIGLGGAQTRRARSSRCSTKAKYFLRIFSASSIRRVYELSKRNCNSYLWTSPYVTHLLRACT